MIFNSVGIRCIFDILKILGKGKSKYSVMFKETKASHTTLQSVLKDLEKRKFIKKKVINHMIINYKITKNGRKLLQKLRELEEILRYFPPNKKR